MLIFADLHIHSKFSRATSKEMELETLEKWALKKGINLLATGDFTYPAYFPLLKAKLESNGKGIFRLKKRFSADPASSVHFLLSTEVSNIYTQGNKGRRIHNLIFAPELEVVEEINKALGKRGNIHSDGRPIFGFSAKELVKIIRNISPDCLVIPAHAWTPWFSVFGSQSGFNSLEECFEEETPSIFALETGLSSDPQMNWRVSGLDKITLISNSDAHSPGRLGREANVFDANLDYYEIREILKNKDKKRFLYTIEFFPQEGKYHYDGHRNCNVVCSPRESKKNNNLCPVCKKGLTLGVMHRVEELADRPEEFQGLGNEIPQRHLVPLEEIIAEAVGESTNTQKVKREYEKMVLQGKNEFNVLLNSSPEELRRFTLPRVIEGIIRVRKEAVEAIPGYDGVYGKIKIFTGSDSGEKKDGPVQMSLF